MMFRSPLAFGALLLLTLDLRAAETGAEAGTFFSQNYSPKIYGAEPQNWAAVQDHRGVMYFGNTDGVLEFDGQKWRKIPLPNASTVRSLAVGDDGMVYVGGQREFGFLKPDSSGTLQYVSLMNRVEDKDRAFNDVWTTLNTRQGVVFSSYKRLFRWSPKAGMEVWKHSKDLGLAFLVDGFPYLAKDGDGLYRLAGESLEPVPGGKAFQHSVALRGIFRFAGSIAVATADTLYMQDGEVFKEYRGDASSLLRSSVIYTCFPLSNGDLAIGTWHGGLILLDANGKLLRVIGRDAGVHSSINALFTDRDRGLWVAMNNGLSRIEIERPMTRFSEQEGIEDIVLSVQRQRDDLYLGTMTGLLHLVREKFRSARFDRVPGIDGQVVALLPTSRGLLAGSLGGLYEVSSSGAALILAKGAIVSLATSATDPFTVYACGRHGLFVLRSDGQRWEEVRHWDSSDQTVWSVAPDKNGQIWATTRSDILRFRLDSDPIKVERFSAKDGVPSGFKKAFSFRGEILFTSKQGLRRFDVQQGRFIPDVRFGAQFADGSRATSLIAEMADRDVWVSGEGYHGVLHRGDSGRFVWEPNLLARSGIREVYGFHEDPDHTIWASGTDGELVRLLGARPSPDNRDYRTLVRQVQVANREKAIFGGTGNLAGLPELQHQENTVRFEFTAPFFEDPLRSEFRTLLQGSDKTWSPWTSAAYKEYSNLWEGRYVLHVQGRDLYGRTSSEATFNFRVLSPLYRRWWAYALYVMGAIGLVWLIIHWRLAAIEARNRMLEEVIRNRTDEIRRQRDEIKLQEEKSEELLLNILPAAVAEELRATGTVQPVSCSDITVCFTDFVGFTAASEKMSAYELVEALHRYFTEFDRIIDKYGLEKLKTIGDSYMFVSGLPESKPAHAVDAVLAALEIVEVVERFADSPPGWKVRVGVHSGPVVAGVVGVRKFAFDIWGETVNFASRHESSGLPNCVNISARTYELVREFFHCEPRGPVLIKEGRRLNMYLARCVSEETGAIIDSSFFRDLYYSRFNVLPPGMPANLASQNSAHG